MRPQDRREKAVPDSSRRPEPDAVIQPKADNEDIDRDYDLKSPTHKPPDGGEASETEVPGR